MTEGMPQHYPFYKDETFFLKLSKNRVEKNYLFTDT